MRRLFLALVWTIGYATNAVAQELPSTACDRLKSLAMPNAKVTAAAVVPAGPFRCDWCTADQTVDVPASCRMTTTMKPTADSDIEMVLWIPLANWNGKLLGVGNANFCGGEDTPRMALGLSEHYAVVATDLGHKGCDASFAVGHPEKLIDFGYRALHETTLRAKDVLAALYGSAPTHSYFSGCSTGGNEALMEVQRYPNDYDGVLAGAPTNYLTHTCTVADSGTRRWGASSRVTSVSCSIGRSSPRAIRATPSGCWTTLDSAGSILKRFCVLVPKTRRAA